MGCTTLFETGMYPIFLTISFDVIFYCKRKRQFYMRDCIENFCIKFFPGPWSSSGPML